IARVSLPVLLGFVQPSSNQVGFEAAVHAHPLTLRIGELAAVAVLLGLAVLGVRSLAANLRADPDPADLLTWVALLSLAFFASSQIESIHATEPRYLLPLYSAVPLVGVVVPRLAKRSTILLPLILAIVVLINVRGWLLYSPDLAAPVLAGHVVRA